MFSDAGSDEVERLFVVLINHEEQYSLWPLGKDIPAGWSTTGQEGTRAQCAQYVDTVWVDMRPLSLRKGLS